MNVGQGGGDDAGGKGGGVQLVFGVQHQRHVQRLDGRFRGLDPVQHPQEVGGVVERAVGRHNLQALAQAVVDGHDHGDLRGQVVALAHVGVVGVVFLVGVVKAERGDRGAQHLHGRGRGGNAAQHVDDAEVQPPGQRQLRLELAQGELVGQNAVPEQVGGLLEGRVLGQLVDVDSAVGQHARFSVDPADAGVCRDNSFQTLPSDSSRHSLRISPCDDFCGGGGSFLGPES
jgi:hypothetical protein